VELVSYHRELSSTNTSRGAELSSRRKEVRVSTIECIMVVKIRVIKRIYSKT
jgi:hypothetical protein